MPTPTPEERAQKTAHRCAASLQVHVEHLTDEGKPVPQWLTDALADLAKADDEE